MATIVLSSYAIRHPVGGVLSNNLQFLTGFARLGHDVYLVEKSGYEGSCFDPEQRISSDDCSSGIRRTGELLARHGLAGRWCYVTADGAYHGMDRGSVEAVFARADVFIDRGMHLSWEDEAADVPLRVLMDPDPGFRQVKLAADLGRGRPVPAYDAYVTYGHNIGSDRSPAPTAGVVWEHLFHPIDTELYVPAPPPGPDRPFTTVMNWTPLETVVHEGRRYGMKDVQFARFVDLPGRVDRAMEIAVEGRGVPRDELAAAGWRLVDALDVTQSYDRYHAYLRASAGEFSVVKDVYHGLRVGWFSDRSAAYLAHGRPVVVQDNGVADHLPTGDGLFEVADPDEAAAAIRRIAADPGAQCAAARRIAERHLDARVVLGRFLAGLGVDDPITTRGRSR